MTEQQPRLQNSSSVFAKAAYNASLPFAIGCTSGIVSTLCIQPIDTLKVRMQLTNHGSSSARISQLSLARAIVAKDGFWNLYQGLSAGLLRALVYGTMRLGLFSVFEQHLERRAHERGTTLGFGGRTVAGLSAGALAALVGTPTEVALIQMQADRMRPVGERNNYKSAFDVIRRVSKQGGIASLWKGTGPTVIRAMSTNFGQLAFFSESKHQIEKYSDMSRKKRAALAATIAGFASSFTSQPFDFVKTRLQNQALRGTSGGLPLYKGTLDCFVKVFRLEGATRFYKDFWPYFLRAAPQSIITLFISDWLTQQIKAWP